jgi:hypothetical protein
MGWGDALAGGGAALSGAAVQQLLSWHSQQRVRAYTEQDRTRVELNHAFADVVKAARRIQRSVADLALDTSGDEARAALRKDVDDLSDAAALVKLMTPDKEVVAAVESFEQQAAEIERGNREAQETHLRLQPLIDAMQSYDGDRRRP